MCVASVSYSLSPDMNPIRFNAKATHRRNRLSKTDETRFFAKLTRNGTTVWEETFHFSDKRRKANDESSSGVSIQRGNTKINTTPITVFDVEKSGTTISLCKKIETNCALRICNSLFGRTSGPFTCLLPPSDVLFFCWLCSRAYLSSSSR